MTQIVIILLISLLWFNFITNRIPKRGREDVSDGNIINAVITNTNRIPDHAATLCAEDGETKYKVKLKASESHLWIKGDSIKILVSRDNPKKYRVLFNDYFKENEKRIRTHAIELIENNKFNLIAAKAVKYNASDLEAIKSSELNSNQIFYFHYLFKSIDRYSIFTALIVILTLGLHFVKGTELKELLIPILLIACLIYYVCSAIKICTQTLTKAKHC